MTFKLQKHSNIKSTTIRLIGRIQSDILDELRTQIADSGPNIVLDLEEVTIVDLDVIRFLQLCGSKGIRISHCSPYIREWMRRERANS